MSTFIIVLVVILVLIFIGQKAFFKSANKTNNDKTYTQPTQSTQQSGQPLEQSDQPLEQSDQPLQQSEQPLEQTNMTENQMSTTISTLYIFKSTTCPACQLYNRENRDKVQNIGKELGLEIKEVDLDSGEPMDLATKNVYDRCGVQYIPTACLVKSNGEIKQLGNGNGLNKHKIVSSM
jgi:hypothetical protein